MSRLEAKRLIMYSLRGFLLYFLFALTLQFTASLLYSNGIRLPGTGSYSSARFTEELKLPFNFAHILLVILIPLLYHSVSRVFLLGDAYGYAATEAIDGTDRKIRLRDVFGTPVYLITLSTSVIGFIVFPLSFGFGKLQAWADFGSVLGAAVEKLLFALPLVLCFAVVLAIASLSVRREWQRIRVQRAAPEVRVESGGLIGFLKNKTGVGGIISAMSLIIWLYPIGSLAGAILLSILLPFLIAMVQNPLSVLIGLCIILGFVLLITLPSYLRAFSKRRKLMRGLRRVCRECGYELTVTGHPYLGLLRFGDAADFSVKVGEKRYDCKLIGAVMPGGKMLFGFDGRVSIHHYIRFFWAARTYHVATQHTFEQSTFHTEMEYAFESENKKIIVVCPAAPQTFVAGPRGGTPIDTGAEIGDYRMFNTTGFLGALERNCLDR